MKSKLIILLFTCIIFIFCISCGQIIKEVGKAVAEVEKESKLDTEVEESKLDTEEKIETEKVEEIEVKVEPIEEVELPSPTPNEGCGNVAGRVFWNSTPVNGAKVLLCENFNIISGCEGKKYESLTDEKGVYVVENIPVEEYALLMQLPGEENYIYAGNIIKGATKIKIEEGKTISLEQMHIFKTDLKLTSPSDKEEIETRNPTLSWEAYQDADYYLIYLAAEAGDIGKLIDEKVKENSYQVKADLLRCKFTWKIEAFNQYGRKIAESEYGNFFIKADCPSCNLKILTPADKEKIKQGSTITLSWEEHPMADKYNIAVSNTETGEYPVKFVKVDATSYQISESIPEGEYYFSVYVLDSFGTNAAYGYSYFTIIK
ncbi:MAG: hypothetical protein L6405_00655 [Actinomycetia bacterium]|nr:hypothetical protein [Actinomycetes bacterium]